MAGGRPSKRSSLDLAQVERLARKGWTDEEMSAFFEVDRATWYRWKAKDQEFCDALKDWKREADARVERSLYERAIGYEHPDVHASNYQGQVTLTPVQKRYAPDTTAAIFWLKNRDPENWRDKQEIEQTNKDDLSGMSEERLNAEIERMQRVAGRVAGKGSESGAS